MALSLREQQLAINAFGVWGAAYTAYGLVLLGLLLYILVMYARIRRAFIEARRLSRWNPLLASTDAEPDDADTPDSRRRTSSGQPAAHELRGVQTIVRSVFRRARRPPGRLWRATTLCKG